MPMAYGTEPSEENMTDQPNDVVAYSFTVTPVIDNEEIEPADPFDRVQFEHPDENYGSAEGFEVTDVKELTERE